MTLPSLPPGSLPPDLAQFVQDQLDQGKYQSAADVVCDGVRLLREREERMATLRGDIDLGIAQLERGEFVELDTDDAVDAFFDDIQTRADQRARPAQDAT